MTPSIGRKMLALLLLVGCRSPSTTPPPNGSGLDAFASPDAALIDASADKTAACAATFGNQLTASFGRVDGTVLAVLPPGNMTCPQANSTHVVLEVTMNGAAYRMVVNVMSTSSDPRVFIYEVDAPLAGPAWAEGWHTGVQLDYVTTLHVAKTNFIPVQQAAAVARLDAALQIGARVSVFSTASGGVTSSTHLIHRNQTNVDGAIVIAPETAPHYLLTAFPEQVF